MRLLLAAVLALNTASALAESPAVAAPPPGLSRSNWDKAVQRARSLNEAVKAQIERMEWAEDGPKAMTPGLGRGSVSRHSRLKRYAASAPVRVLVPAVTTTTDLKTFAPKAEQPALDPVVETPGLGLLPMDPLVLHAMPSLDQTLAPLGPEAVAPQVGVVHEPAKIDPRCADPRARADARRCPSAAR